MIPPTRKQLWGKLIKAGFRFVALAHVYFIAFIALCCIIFINGNPPFTSLMLQRSKGQFWKMADPEFIDLRHVPKTFKRLVVKLEDPNFYTHWGVDVDAIRRAAKLNERMGYKAYGGSTISQQLARTLFLTQHKNYVRKYIELIVAVEMELILGKDRILELYINYAEWGKNVYGAQSASQHYYQKDLPKTTTDQQLRLITILASPLKYSPTTYHKRKILRTRYRFLQRNL